MEEHRTGERVHDARVMKSREETMGRLAVTVAEEKFRVFRILIVL